MSSNLVGAWADVLFAALVRAGVSDVVVSPGSRSTPLVLGAAKHPRLRVTDAVDERAAAFFALGQARVTGRPTALVCTSGSAPAHYHPAVLEADRAEVPLLVLSADRPWELHEAGSNQTVDQVKLYGTAVRAAFDVAAPEPRERVFRALRRLAGQAVAASLAPRPGPVHVNLRFRKPLEPGPAAPGELPSGLAEAVATIPAEDAVDPSPGPRVVPPGPGAGAGPAVDAIAETLADAARVWVVAGTRGLRPAEAPEAAGEPAWAALARHLGAALLPEAASQLRFLGPETRRGLTVWDAFDPLLRTVSAAPALAAAIAPEVVLTVGAAPVSPAVDRFLRDAAPAARRIAIHPHRVIDPEGTVDRAVIGDPDQIARALLDRLPGAAGAWPEGIADAARGARDDALEAVGFTEATVARDLPAGLPEGALLIPGNSLPIRVLDAVADGDEAPSLGVPSQRGASGIDGLVSGAAGSAQASGRPTALLVGDISFQHDVGGLALAAAVDAAPLLVVVVRNGGGRIFEQLPVASHPSAAGALAHFTTPNPEVDFGALCRGFGVAHRRVDDAAGFRAAVADALAGPGGTVVEVVVPPDGARRALAAQRDALRLRLTREGS